MSESTGERISPACPWVEVERYKGSGGYWKLTDFWYVPPTRVGSGPAVIFRNGQAFEGLWARPKRDDMLVFRDKTGQIPIPLKPGNTWIELIPVPPHKWAFEASWSGED